MNKKLGNTGDAVKINYLISFKFGKGK